MACLDIIAPWGKVYFALLRDRLFIRVTRVLHVCYKSMTKVLQPCYKCDRVLHNHNWGGILQPVYYHLVIKPCKSLVLIAPRPTGVGFGII